MLRLERVFRMRLDTAHGPMIKSFRHKGIKALYEKGDRRKVPPEQATRILRILTHLDTARGPEAMNLDGFRTHALTGNLAGFWSSTVTRNMRVIYRFEDGHARDVDLTDYH